MEKMPYALNAVLTSAKSPHSGTANCITSGWYLVFNFVFSIVSTMLSGVKSTTSRSNSPLSSFYPYLEEGVKDVVLCVVLVETPYFLHSDQAYIEIAVSYKEL